MPKISRNRYFRNLKYINRYGGTIIGDVNGSEGVVLEEQYLEPVTLTNASPTVSIAIPITGSTKLATVKLHSYTEADDLYEDNQIIITNVDQGTQYFNVYNVNTNNSLIDVSYVDKSGGNLNLSVTGLTASSYIAEYPSIQISTPVYLLAKQVDGGVDSIQLNGDFGFGPYPVYITNLGAGPTDPFVYHSSTRIQLTLTGSYTGNVYVMVYDGFIRDTYFLELISFVSVTRNGTPITKEEFNLDFQIGLSNLTTLTDVKFGYPDLTEIELGVSYSIY